MCGRLSPFSSYISLSCASFSFFPFFLLSDGHLLSAHFCVCFVASLDSTAQTGTGDWQEEVYQKVIWSFFAHLIAPTSGGLKGEIKCQGG